jgi:hypothetical protein
MQPGSESSHFLGDVPCDADSPADSPFERCGHAGSDLSKVLEFVVRWSWFLYVDADRLLGRGLVLLGRTGPSVRPSSA